MILVTGATGHFGSAAIEFLLSKGESKENIIALVRDESKASDLKAKGIIIRAGDYDDSDSLIKAFTGVDKLLFVSGSDIQNRGRQHQNVVNAAKQAGVKHIVYTSFERKDESETSPIAMVASTHISTENQIKASGIPYTILRDNFYLDMLPGMLGKKVFDTGIFLPAGDTAAAFATRNDMAEGAALILTGSGHENKEYSFSNSENVSFQDIADVLSEISGKKVGYIQPSTEVYINTLTDAGVPKEYAALYAGFATAFKNGEFTMQTRDLENLLGRKPTSAREYLQAVYR